MDDSTIFELAKSITNVSKKGYEEGYQVGYREGYTKGLREAVEIVEGRQRRGKNK